MNSDFSFALPARPGLVDVSFAQAGTFTVAETEREIERIQ